MFKMHQGVFRYILSILVLLLFAMKTQAPVSYTHLDVYKRQDGYSFKGTQISRDYSFGKLNARFEGMEKHVSPKSNSTLQYEQGYHLSLIHI